MRMSLVSRLMPPRGWEPHKLEGLGLELSTGLASPSRVLPAQQVFLLLVIFEDK